MTQDRDLEPPSPLARIGQSCAIGWLAAVICALPTAWRASGHGASFAAGWLMGAAVWACLLLPVALIAPRAARGWRGVVGQNPPAGLGAGLAIGAALGVISLVLLGSALRAKTHHLGLGGAAFGAVGAAALGACAAVAGRIVAAGRALRDRGVPARGLALAPALLVAAALVAVLAPLSRADAAGQGIRAVAWDAVLGVAVMSLALSRGLPGALRRPARLVGLPIAAFTVIAGAARIETPGATRAVIAGGGLPGAVLAALQHWSDRDGDGASAHFGGGDCDEGDPRRHPGAPEIAGDGVDSDCDGRDDPTSSPPPDAGVVPATFAPAKAPSQAASPSAAASALAPRSRPDLILVTLDTVRADFTSVYGYAKDTTPELARLAGRGLVFEHAYAAGSETQLALTPLVSGNTLADTPHTRIEWPAIDERVDTLAERLQRGGYGTAAVVSFTWLRRDRGIAQGFDRFDESPFRDQHPEKHATGDKAIDAAIAAYRALSAADKPLFLWVHLFDAHALYLKHDGLDFGNDEAGRYAGEIAFDDRELGRLIDAVQSGPRAKQTVWLVHGSHGEAFGEHGADGHGALLFDEAIRVPLVIVGAGVRAGRLFDTAVGAIDIAPTLCDLAELPKNGLGGQSLMPALRGEPLAHAPLFARAYRRTAVIDWPLKLVSLRHKSGKLTLSLYDLAADPAERNDLVMSRATDARRLDALLLAAGGQP